MNVSSRPPARTLPKAKQGRGRPATDPVVVEVFHRLLDWGVPTSRAAVLCKLPKRGKPKKKPEALGRNLQVRLLADRKSTMRATSVCPYEVARADWKNIPDAPLRLLAHTGQRSGKFERMMVAHYVELLSQPGAPEADYLSRRAAAASAFKIGVALSTKAVWAHIRDRQRAAEEASKKSSADLAAYMASAPKRRAEHEARIAQLNERRAAMLHALNAWFKSHPKWQEACLRLGLDPQGEFKNVPINARSSTVQVVTTREDPPAPWTPPDPDEFLAASERSWGTRPKRAETAEWLLEAWDRRYGKK